MTKTLSPRVHDGPVGNNARKDATCAMCEEPIKGHPICAKCSVLIHDIGAHPDENGADITGSADGVVCLACAERTAPVPPSRPNMRCSVCLVRTRGDSKPKSWHVMDSCKLMCKNCYVSDCEPDDMPREPVPTRMRADELLEEFARNRRKVRRDFKPWVVFRYY